MAQQMVVSERGRCDFIYGIIELLKKVDGCLIPRRCEPCHFDRFAEGIDHLVFRPAKLEAAFQVAIGQAKGGLARLGEFLRRVDHLYGALLEFDCIAAGSHRDTYQLLRKIKASVVVDADLRDDVTGLIVTNQPVAES